MRLPDLTLHEPSTLADAAAILAGLGPAARVLAGGTDFVVDLKSGRIPTPPATPIEHLISLGRIAELRGIRRAGPESPRTNGHPSTGLRIGAMTTIGELHRSLLLTGPYTPLRDATQEMAATQVRNMATIGGNIAGGVPCADLPPILLVMNASVIISSALGERTVPLRSFFLGPRRTLLAHAELLTAILLPEPPRRSGAAYARFALRDGNAIAVASVAAQLELADNGAITHAALALGAVAPIPTLVAGASAALVGRILDEGIDDAIRAAAAAASPITDIRGSADYRRELVRVLTRRALAAALARARENEP
jgi:carbon-monoxide dehydrogenase medium subunit